MAKVIPHQKPKKEPKPYVPPKPKRYAVEKFLYSYDDWYFVEDFHFAFNAKHHARFGEEQQPHFKWRVVDRKR